MTDLEIIIVSYNSEFWLKKTLSTLKEFYLKKTKLSVDVTVVDNNSEDTSVETVRKEYSWANLVELHKNMGFAAANNVAIEKSKAKYVMLLNSDVEFTSNSKLDTLVRYLDDHEDVAVITPKIEFLNGQIDPACHRGEPTPWASLTYFFGLEKLFPHSKIYSQYHQWYKLLNTVHTIDACSGAAMIVRRSAIANVGMLDEQFFMYAEDLDWCKRFKEAGHKIIYYPKVTVIHHKYKSGIKGTSKKIARNTRRHFYDTMLQYYDKHYRHKYPGVVRSIIKYFIIIKKGAV